MTLSDFLKSGLVGAMALALMASFAEAAPPNCDVDPTHRKCKGGDEEPEPDPDPPTLSPDANWLHSDVGIAHSYGWTGVGSRITVIDDFSSSDYIKGRLQNDGGLGSISERTHGQWTSLMTYLTAPGATDRYVDWNVASGLTWDSAVFDSVNLSYGLIARNRFASVYNNWDNLGQLHKSVLDAVDGDLALAVKSAGNDGNGVAVGGSVKGTVDVFAQQFVRIIEGDTSNGDVFTLDPATGERVYSYMAPIIFAGALEWNPDGTEGDDIDGVLGMESIASYSTVAGSNVDVQNHFLVVGVEGGRSSGDEFANYGSACGSVDNGTCLYGTSFAAPIIAGYAAIVAEKFTSDSGAIPAPSLVAQQLLDTAETDTISGYSPSIHGRGEASLLNALAPVSMK